MYSITQSRRRSLSKGGAKKDRDDSDSGWSDNENDSAQPPPVSKPIQRNSSWKPAVNKPPEKSKPPPAAVKTNPVTLASRKSSIEGSSATAAADSVRTHTATAAAQGPSTESAHTPVPSNDGPTTGVFSREAELEAQLEKTHSELIAARREKAALEKSVLELQDRLTMAETHGSSTLSMEQGKIGTMEANIRRGEREKDLEKQLVKVKKEKDKALRLLISLIGKDRIADHLQQHAGAPDLLDSLVTAFGSHNGHSYGHTQGGPPMVQGTATRNNHHRPRTAGNAKSTVSTLGRAHYRSRIDEYFHMNS